MIVDNIERLSRYYTLHRHMEAVGQFYSHAMSQELVNGRYELEGDSYVIITDYMTKGFGSEYESHHKFIDLHVTIEGAESYAWLDVSQQRASGDYDDAGDCIMYEGTVNSSVTVDPGSFILFSKEDGHIPSGHPKASSEKVRKMIFKLDMNEGVL